MKVFYERGSFVGDELSNAALFLGVQFIRQCKPKSLWSGWHMYLLLVQNDSCICFPCHLTTSIIFPQHFIKSFNLGQVLFKSNI